MNSTHGTTIEQLLREYEQQKMLKRKRKRQQNKKLPTPPKTLLTILSFRIVGSHST